MSALTDSSEGTRCVTNSCRTRARFIRVCSLPPVPPKGCINSTRIDPKPSKRICHCLQHQKVPELRGCCHSETSQHLLILPTPLNVSVQCLPAPGHHKLGFLVQVGALVKPWGFSAGELWGAEVASPGQGKFQPVQPRMGCWEFPCSSKSLSLLTRLLFPGLVNTE